MEGFLKRSETEIVKSEIAKQIYAVSHLVGSFQLRSGRISNEYFDKYQFEADPILLNAVVRQIDLIFIDADKPSNPEYLAWALKLSRRGSLIIADNVVRNGSVIEANSDDPSVQGVRRFNELLASEPGVSATAIQTVGNKGYDGFAIALVTSDN